MPILLVAKFFGILYLHINILTHNLYCSTILISNWTFMFLIVLQDEHSLWVQVALQEKLLLSGTSERGEEMESHQHRSNLLVHF